MDARNLPILDIKKLTLLAVIPAGLGIVWSSTTAVSAQTPLPPSAVGAAANESLVTHFATGVGRPHQLVVVDSRQKVIAVYSIDPSSGEISLSSVRNITWDLQLPEHNTTKPLPKEIRNALDESR